MIGKRNTAFYWVIIGLVAISSNLSAQENHGERLLKVNLRRIGHELLLLSKDSTSRILPIEKQGDHFVMSFDSDFELDPEDLTTSVNTELKTVPTIARYLVEVITCASKKVVYSYQFNVANGPMKPSCRGRVLPKGCYTISFTIWGSKTPVSLLNSRSNQKLKWIFSGFLIAALVGMTGFIFKRNKKKSQSINSLELISIGSFQFDPVQMKLIHPNGEYELTGKEVDLLSQLHASINQIVEREVILQTVWGDEGDYIGRTLDVFISKLRKKLEVDSTVRIINIRGVGYKLVVE
jgi:hypothetical protein